MKSMRAGGFGLNTQIAKVYKEYENIDIYITDGMKHIILENKIKAPDQNAQIRIYIETIKDKNINNESKIYVLFFLGG